MRAELVRLGEVREDDDEAEDRADDAHRRRVAAGRLEYLGLVLAVLLEDRDVVLEELAEGLGVRAVDDVAQALLEERVLPGVEGLHVLLEGQKAVAARLLGEGDEAQGEVLLLGRGHPHGVADELGDGQDVAEVEGGEEGAEGAAEYDDEGGGQDEARPDCRPR